MSKKIFVMFLSVLIFGMCYSLTGLMEAAGPGAAPEDGLASSKSYGPMPASMPQDYYFKEKAILQNLLVQSHSLDTYYAAFATTRITQADIDRRYDEYDEDMGILEREIAKSVNDIAELNPATGDAKAHQKDTLEKLYYLQSIVSEYREHEVSANDTTAYLSECRQALARIFPQGKMSF